MVSPVLVIIFNRPDYCEALLQILEQVKPPRIYIAADGPRLDVVADEANCAASRAVFNDFSWPCQVKRLFRKRNLGCGLAVSTAISWFFQNETEGIILEDDLRPSLQFFAFCDAMLEQCREDPRVMQITGDNFQFGRKRGNHAWYFSRFNHIWGWASWARAWQHYHFDIQNLAHFEKHILPECFPEREDAAHWQRVFRNIQKHRVDTWDNQWTYSCFYHGGLTVTPNANLVTNVGFDERGTHTKGECLTSRLVSEDLEEPWDEAPPVEICLEADNFVNRTVFCQDEQRRLHNILEEIENRIALGLYDAATALLHRLLVQYAESPAALQLLSLCLSKAGRLNEALPYIKNLLKLNPANVNAQILFARIANSFACSQSGLYCRDEIHIALASDEVYSDTLLTAVGSTVLAASENDKLVFHILDGGLSPTTKARLQQLCNMCDGKLDFPSIPNLDLPPHRCSPCAYYRVMLPSILPDLEKILYLDCDVLVLDSLQQLWNTPLNDAGVACARDAIDYMRQDRSQTDHFARLGFRAEDHYFNSGVMLMNLEKMRKRNLERRFFVVREQIDSFIRFSDQDVFNMIYRKDHIELDQKWNYQAPMAYFPNEIFYIGNFRPAIIHYTTDEKPWKAGGECPLKNTYLEMQKKVMGMF